MDSERFEQIWAPYRHELRRDYVSLSELVRHVRWIDPGLDDRGARETTLEVVRNALTRGDAEAGQFVDGAFTAWVLAPDEVVRRAAAEWDELGDRVPNPGEILWLNEPNA
ncbi:MAG: hypothetical protein QOI61_1520 [Actinomycetota bacterium]